MVGGAEECKFYAVLFKKVRNAAVREEISSGKGG